MKLLYITDIGSLALPQPPTPLSASNDTESAQGSVSTSPQFVNSLPAPPVEVLHDVWIKIQDGRVLEVGPEGTPKPAEELDSVNRFSAQNGLVTPGFVDSHTHPVFAGWRQSEFVDRCRGKTYQEIAASGGGIQSSVEGVRAAPREELSELILTRLNHFLESGTTTIEAKSGYGLSFDAEIKSLHALREAASRSAIDVSPTLLGAHVTPAEYAGRTDEYVEVVCKRMIPIAAKSGLAESVDLFLDKGAFDPAAAGRIFEAGLEAGLKLRIHADQFGAGDGAELAAEFGAISADHMDYTTPEGMKRLATAGVTVVLLPGAVFFLGLEHYAPAREMIERGCLIALATDFNPGSSPTTSMPLMMSIACIKMGLTPAEALWACTMGGAHAIGRETSVGTLLPGFQADLSIWAAEDIDFLPYSYGNMIPSVVFKRGDIVAEKGRLLSNPEFADTR